MEAEAAGTVPGVILMLTPIPVESGARQMALFVYYGPDALDHSLVAT